MEGIDRPCLFFVEDVALIVGNVIDRGMNQGQREVTGLNSK